MKKRASSKKQVSLRGETYAKIKKAAEAQEKTVTSLVDELCTKFLDEEAKL